MKFLLTKLSDQGESMNIKHTLLILSVSCFNLANAMDGHSTQSQQDHGNQVDPQNFCTYAPLMIGTLAQLKEENQGLHVASIIQMLYAKCKSTNCEWTQNPNVIRNMNFMIGQLENAEYQQNHVTHKYKFCNLDLVLKDAGKCIIAIERLQLLHDMQEGNPDTIRLSVSAGNQLEALLRECIIANEEQKKTISTVIDGLRKENVNFLT